jgi:hypothetical protein
MHWSFRLSMRVHACVVLRNVHDVMWEIYDTSWICSGEAVDFHSNRTMWMTVILNV